MCSALERTEGSSWAGCAAAAWAVRRSCTLCCAACWRRRASTIATLSSMMPARTCEGWGSGYLSPLLCCTHFAGN